MTTSGTVAFNLPYSDIVLDAFERCQITPTQIQERRLMQSAATSAGLILTDWSGNRGVNLWGIDQQSILLVQGVRDYALPSDTVQMLDTYIRTFQLSQTLNVAPAFSTTSGQPSIRAVVANHGLSIGSYFGLSVPVAIDSLLLSGFYLVTSVIDANTFTFNAAGNASSTTGPGGTVPSFTTTLGSSFVSVTLPNHGLQAGFNFNVAVATTVGGILLSGAYVVQSVQSPSTFTIQAATTASANATVSENNGQAQVEIQAPNTDPQDRIIFPVGRSQYDAIPDKFQQSPPTTYWNERTLQQFAHVWPTPDGNGPYVLYYRRMRQLQDYSPVYGITADMPTRLLRAFTLELAADLAHKHAPARFEENAKYAQVIYDKAWESDTENVPIEIVPALDHYWRV